MPLDDTNYRVADETLDEVGRVLMKAAGIVRERWCKYGMGTPGGPRCAVGAIAEVTSYIITQFEAVSLLASRVGVDGQNEWDIVMTWNDGEGQTAENVAAVMEQAARVRA